VGPVRHCKYDDASAALTRDYGVIATWQVLREALRLEERAGGLLVLEDLERLRADDMLSQDKELEIWRRIRDQAPGLFAGTALTVGGATA
jgi:hypothetical protein